VEYIKKGFFFFYIFWEFGFGFLKKYKLYI